MSVQGGASEIKIMLSQKATLKLHYIEFKLKEKVKEGHAETSCVLTILVDIVVVITELERLLKHLLMTIHRIKWYNDVTSVVSDGCIVS